MVSLIGINPDSNFLITTDKWFIAPNGKSYRAVWGKVSIHNDKQTLGIETNDKSANWYCIVGSPEKAVILAGCQIHYACVCKEPPFTGKLSQKMTSEHMARTYTDKFETNIYLAQ